MNWTGEKAALLDAARASCGHDDFGDASFHDGLGVLLAALDDRPPPEGDVPSVRALIVQSVAARLITRAGWQANPGYADRDIAAPLVIIGLPHAGTTALHNLLSQDPQFQGIEKWLSSAPKVRPPRATWDGDPQYAAIRDEVAQAFDRDRILVRGLGFWREAVRRVMAAQDRAPECFANIRQERIRQDPVGVVRTIYERFGLTLSAGAEAAMRDQADRYAAGAHGGGHDYAPLADCGAFDAAFAAYKDRFVDAE